MKKPKFIKQARLPRGAYVPDLGKVLSHFAMKFECPHISGVTKEAREELKNNPCRICIADAQKIYDELIEQEKNPSSAMEFMKYPIEVRRRVHGKNV